MASLVEKSEGLAKALLPETYLNKTSKNLRSTNVFLSGPEFCGIALIVSFMISGALFALSIFISFPFFISINFIPGIIYAVISFLITFFAITRVIPLYLIQQRVGELEEALPDGLRQMSVALKAGVSIDQALEDVADSDYGALSEEFEYTLAQIRRGRSINEALRAMANRAQSELFERAFYLVVEGMERGANLADVLESVASDIREVHTVQRERRAATMQQILFLLAAALFAGPFIAGLVISVGESFSSHSGAAGGGAAIGIGGAGGTALPDIIPVVIPLYIAIQAAITALAIGVIRYGDMSKGLMFIFPFVGGSLAVFYGANYFSAFMFPG